MVRDSRKPFYIAQWLIQPSQNRIIMYEHNVRVEPKVMDVLLCLAEHPGEVVSRETLLETVWAGTIVTDDVLTRCISELRKAFHDNPRRPRIIETIPKTGYLLLAPVTATLEGDHVPALSSFLEMTPTTATGEKLPSIERMLWTLVGGLALFALLVYLSFKTAGLLNPEIHHPTPLTSYPGTEGAPVLSPDGKQVAFTWHGPDQDNVDVYVKLTDTGAPLRLTDDPARDFQPAWSPNATEIAYMHMDDDGCAIRLISALGGPSRKLTDCGANIYGDLTWSPDGQWLAYNDKADPAEAYRIYLVSPTTLEKRPLTTPPADAWGDHDPAFSPDGTQLSFTRSLSEGMQDIYRYSFADASSTRLTFDSRNISGHAWTRSGRFLVFSSNRSGQSGLWRIGPDGGTPRWLGLHDGMAYGPSIAAGRLAYLQYDSEVNIWEVSLANATQAAPLVTSTRWDLHPHVSPDGQYLAFTSNRSGSYEIWRMNRDGSDLVQLTHFGGPFTSTPRWSPDGQHLVFTARPYGHADVYRMHIEERIPQPLTETTTDEMAASWSPDGQWIYFSTNRSGAWEVWKMTARGEDATPVTPAGGFGPQLSPDGNEVYYTKPHTPGLWRMALSGTTETRILDHLDSRDWGSWTLLDNNVYFIQRGRPAVLASYDLTTAAIDTLYIPQQQIPTMDPAFTISSDGAWLLFGQVDRAESDIMFIERFE